MKPIYLINIFLVLFLLQICFCKENITVICLVPFISSFSPSRFLIKAAEMAINDINQANFILANYHLQIKVIDSKVINISIGLKSYFISVNYCIHVRLLLNVVKMGCCKTTIS